MGEPVARRSSLLSESYAQGLERISQQSGIGFFELPADVVAERERTWDKLFQKYSAELSDEIEINFTSPSDEEEVDEDDENGEAEEEYYSKSRMPMRKSKDLVQYWVDTGNPPYKLIDDIQRSDSGTSLSEADSPKPQSLKKTPGTSVDSSVDTAAYILSNTNVTKRAEAAAIVEGARTPPASSKGHASPPSPNYKRDARDNNASFTDPSEIISKLGAKIRKKSQDRSRQSSQVSESSELELRKVAPTSMKIMDILPTLEQMDKLISKSNLHKLKVTSDVASGGSSGQRTPCSLSPNKKLNKRKLYTGRDSPMDVIVSSTISEDQIVPRASFHPAFLGTPKPKPRPSLVRRKSLARTRQKVSPDNGKDSSDPSERKFLKTLGLIPTPRFNTRTKRKIVGGVKWRRSPRKRRAKPMVRKYDVNSNNRSVLSRSLVWNSEAKDIPNLVEACSKRLLSVTLERLSETFLTKLVEKHSDDKIFDEVSRKSPRSEAENDDNEKNNNRKEQVKDAKVVLKRLEGPILSKTLRSAKSSGSSRTLVGTIKNNSPPQKIEVDSMDSDESTIIIYKCQPDVSLDVGQTEFNSDGESSLKTVEIPEKELSQPKQQKEGNLRVQSLQHRKVENKQNQSPEIRQKNKSSKTKKLNTAGANSDKTLETIGKNTHQVNGDEKTDADQQYKMDKNEQRDEKENKKNPRCTTLGTFISDNGSDSSSCSRNRTVRRRRLNPTVTFSSDEENNFIENMERGADKYEKKIRQKSALSKDQVQLINSLTNNTSVSLLLTRIADSDEEIIDVTRSDVKPRRPKSKNTSTNTKIQTPAKKSSPRLSSSSQNSNVARTLTFDDSLQKPGELIESPPKKFKTENGVINRQSARSRRSSRNSPDFENSSNDSMKLLLGKARANGLKRKSDSEEDNSQKTGIIISTTSPVTRSQSPAKKNQSPLKASWSPRSSTSPKIASKALPIPVRRRSPRKSSKGVKLKELHVVIPKMSNNLEKRVRPRVKSTPRLSVSLKKSRGRTTTSRKRPLPSDDDDSDADFFTNSDSPENAEKLGESSSSTDTPKFTKLFPNPFEDFGDELPFNSRRGTRGVQNFDSRNRKSVMTLRTRHMSDSDD